jgi:hypothetical protein
VESLSSASVAIALLAAIAAISIAAIARYPIDDALKVWSALSALVGIVTGAFVTYFFTRQATQQAQKTAQQAQQTAQQAQETTHQAQRHAQQAQLTAVTANRALTKIAGEMNPQIWANWKTDPTVAAALEAPADARSNV